MLRFDVFCAACNSGHVILGLMYTKASVSGKRDDPFRSLSRFRNSTGTELQVPLSCSQGFRLIFQLLASMLQNQTNDPGLAPRLVSAPAVRPRNSRVLFKRSYQPIVMLTRSFRVKNVVVHLCFKHLFDLVIVS